MEKNTKTKKDYYVIDLLHIVKTLWNKIWLLILSTIVVAGVGFSLAKFVVTPKYSSDVMLYVNNSSTEQNGSTISSSQITAAQSLVKTYRVILKSRTTLEMVIQETGVDYTYDKLYKMVEAEAVDETEILRVTVTSEDAAEAALIANKIAEILPKRISEVIIGSSMKVVAYGVENNEKVSPNTLAYTLVGGVMGFLVMATVVSVMAIVDDTIHDEEYIQKSYDYPILAKIPDLLADESSSGYKSYRKYYATYQQDELNAK